MFIVWSRWGILAILFVAAGVAFGPLVLTPLLFGADPTNGQFSIGMGIGLIIVGAIMWGVVWLTVGKLIDKVGPRMAPREVHDEQGKVASHELLPVLDGAGQPVIQRPVSTLFWIPVRIWPYVLAGVGVLFVIFGLF